MTEKTLTLDEIKAEFVERITLERDLHLDLFGIAVGKKLNCSPAQLELVQEVKADSVIFYFRKRESIDELC